MVSVWLQESLSKVVRSSHQCTKYRLCSTVESPTKEIVECERERRKKSVKMRLGEPTFNVEVL